MCIRAGTIAQIQEACAEEAMQSPPAPQEDTDMTPTGPVAEQENHLDAKATEDKVMHAQEEVVQLHQHST